MTPSRWSLAHSIIIALLGLSPIVVSSSTLSDRSCAGLIRWAESYRGTHPTLEHLARLDRAERRAVANVLTPTVLAGLWKEQLTRFGDRPELSPEQRTLVREAQELVTPALFYEHSNATAAVREFWTRAERVFPLPAHRRTFLELAPNAQRQPVMVVGRAPLCECNGQLGDDCGAWRCGLPNGCRSWTGCGPLGRYPCNGVCVPWSEAQTELRPN